MAPPIYLLGAIAAVERVLRAAGPDGMTPAQVAEQLQGEGYRWPLPNRSGSLHGASARDDPTPERVRRVCKLRGNATKIEGVAGTAPPRFRLESWAR